MTMIRNLKYYILFVITYVILYFVFKKYREGFQGSRCNTFQDCTSCAGASGCSWCPKSKVCLNSTSLKSTDKECNQMNTISSDFRCKTIADNEIPPPDVVLNDEKYDFTLFKDKIKNRIPPPNAYTSGKVEYSAADVMSNMNDVRNTVANYQLQLPGIISSSVEGQIQPMVKGILSQNYYIQGFADYGCNYSTCRECTDDRQCGWDPLKTKCDKRGPNPTQYITQPQRCVLTPSTLNLMRTQPN